MYVEKGVTSGEELLHVVERIEGQLLQRALPRRLRLIVIDSIANVFRCVDTASCDPVTDSAPPRDEESDSCPSPLAYAILRRPRV